MPAHISSHGVFQKENEIAKEDKAALGNFGTLFETDVMPANRLSESCKCEWSLPLSKPRLNAIIFRNTVLCQNSNCDAWEEKLPSDRHGMEGDLMFEGCHESKKI